MKKIRQVYANKGVEVEYRAKLNKLVDAMYKSVLYWILVDTSHKTATEVAKQLQKRIKQWKKVFGKNADKIALWFVNSVRNHTENGLRRSFLESGYTPKVKTPNNVLKAIECENKGLINSIPDKFFDGVEVLAMMTVLYSWDKTKLSENITKKYNVAIRRNKIIASDQNHKSNQIIKMAICDTLKIKWAVWKYTWRSEIPRESHIAMDGMVFDLDVGCYNERENKYIYPAEEYNCYHKDTEVMTEEGFKKFTELKKDDRILTLNPYTKEIEYSGIKHFIKKWSDDIAHIKGKTLDMSVDKNHRFFTYREIDHEKYRAVEPEFVVGINNLKTKAKFYKSCEWNKKSGEMININGLEMKTETFCKFMGYYLSDGSYLHKRKCNQISIAKIGAQLDKEYEDLKELNPHKGKACLYFFNKELRKYVEQFGYSNEKFIPKEIKNLSKEQIRIFLDAYSICDGTPKKKGVAPFGKDLYSQPMYYTSSKRMASDLCECIIKTGMACSMTKRNMKGKIQKFKNGTYTIKTDLYTVREIVKTHDQMCTAKITIEPYNDFVYDIEVEKNNTLLVRFGNCVHWNGNCKCDFEPLIEEPGENLRALVEKNVYYKNIAKG